MIPLLFINDKFVTDFQEKAVFNSILQNNAHRSQAVVSYL